MAHTLRITTSEAFKTGVKLSILVIFQRAVDENATDKSSGSILPSIQLLASLASVEFK